MNYSSLRVYTHRPPRSIDKYLTDGDYLVAPLLQIYAADHCTQRCHFCTTSAPHRKAHEGDIEAFIKYINQMYSDRIKFAVINILGGEPFLHSNLSGFVRRLREGMAYPARFVVTTNGFWLNEMDEHPSGLEAGDRIIISRYADVIRDVGGIDRYNSLISKLSQTRPETIEITDAFHFREWEFSEEPVYGFPLDCDLADNVSLADDGTVHRCCVAPASRFSPRATKAFLDRSEELEFKLNRDTDLRSWLQSPLPDACGYCTAHYNTPYYPLRSLTVSGEQYLFTQGANRDMLQSGFSSVEPGGVWTDGPEAIMTFQSLPRGRAKSPYITFLFFATAFLTENVREMSVTIEVVGSSWRDKWVLPRSDVANFADCNDLHALFVPHEVLDDQGPFTLKFTIDPAHSPKAAGLSDDSRDLGLFFRYVLVEI
ncbi:radical SAM protein [Rhodopseudomonas sp.]|uniref:radical SAM protein n=1 Tax=Rhodopseudomonas sp. TaxID=1078 RepID=UPI003B3A662E